MIAHLELFFAPSLKIYYLFHLAEGVIEAALPPDPSSIIEQSYDISDAIVNSVEIASKRKENDEA